MPRKLALHDAPTITAKDLMIIVLSSLIILFLMGLRDWITYALLWITNALLYYIIARAIYHRFIPVRKPHPKILNLFRLYSAALLVLCLLSELVLHSILIGNVLNILACSYLPFLIIVQQYIGIAALAAIAAIALTSLRHVSLQRMLRTLASLPEKLLKITLLLLVSAIAIAIALYALVEVEYPKKVEVLRNSVGDKCLLDKAWDLVKHYKGDFISTYKTIWPKPRQLIIRFGPLTLEPSRVFAAKLAAVSGTGACEDFALGATQLLSDVLGCETRVVAFLGEDHALPEVKVSDAWYVVDITYTTPESPVKASEYAEHLRATRPCLYSRVKGVIEAYTGRDLSAEHGFAATGG
jgi:hypothetical protein